MKPYSKETVELLRRVRVTIPRGSAEKFLLAVSGGIDSVVLLNLFVQLRLSEQLEIGVAHFDHGFREDSASDAEFVSQLCVDHALPFFLGKAPPLPSGVNLEGWARERRYEFLFAVGQEQRFSWICTAHHEDDQVETLLMRLLSGRLATRAFTIAARDDQRNLLRPLIKVSRKEIERYQQEFGFAFRYDSTNGDLHRTRNRVRGSLLPILESGFNPSVRRALGEIGERLNMDESYLWSLAKAESVELQRNWRSEHFCRLPEAIRWRVLSLLILSQRALGPLGEDRTGEKIRELETKRECGYRALKALEGLIIAGTTPEFTLDMGDLVRVRYSSKGGLEILSPRK